MSFLCRVWGGISVSFLSRVRVVANTTVSTKQLVDAMVKVATDAKFDDADHAFWQCHDFSVAVYLVAKLHNIEVSVYSCSMVTKLDHDGVDIGDSLKHSYLKVDNLYYDMTLRQFDPNTPFPYITNNPHPNSVLKVGGLSSDDGTIFWEKKIEEQLR